MFCGAKPSNALGELAAADTGVSVLRSHAPAKLQMQDDAGELNPSVGQVEAPAPGGVPVVVCGAGVVAGTARAVAFFRSSLRRALNSEL